MKPAREPASCRPKPCASLKKPHESCPFAAPCGPRKKIFVREEDYYILTATAALVFGSHNNQCFRVTEVA